MYIIIWKGLTSKLHLGLGFAAFKLTVVDMVLLGVLLLVLVALFLVVDIAMGSLIHHEQEEVERKKENKNVSIKSFFRSFRALSIPIKVKVLFFRIVEHCRENV